MLLYTSHGIMLSLQLNGKGSGRETAWSIAEGSPNTKKKKENSAKIVDSKGNSRSNIFSFYITIRMRLKSSYNMLAYQYLKQTGN